MNFRQLGRKHCSAHAFAALRKRLDRRISRSDVAAFRAAFPKTYATLKAAKADASQRLRARDLYDYLYHDESPSCEECGTPVVKWNTGRQSYQNYCSRSCINASDAVVEKRRQTGIARFGCEPNLHPSVNAKKVATFRRNLGVDNPTQSVEVKERVRQRFRDNWGHDHWTQHPSAETTFDVANPMHDPEIRRRIECTNMRRYGSRSPFGSKRVQHRSAATNMERYGVRNSGAVASPYKRRLVTDRFGAEHVVQGFEPRAIEWLSSHDNVKRIVSSITRLPTIRYTGGMYHPDILAVTANGHRHLIEVKSAWTLLQCFTANVAKFMAATRFMKRRGGTFWLFFVERKRITRIRNPTSAYDLRDLVIANPRLARLFRVSVPRKQRSSRRRTARDDRA